MKPRQQQRFQYSEIEKHHEAETEDHDGSGVFWQESTKNPHRHDAEQSPPERVPDQKREPGAVSEKVVQMSECRRCKAEVQIAAAMAGYGNSIVRIDDVVPAGRLEIAQVEVQAEISSKYRRQGRRAEFNSGAKSGIQVNSKHREDCCDLETEWALGSTVKHKRQS